MRLCAIKDGRLAMYTLELEIEQQMPMEAKDVCHYTVSINTSAEARPPDSCQDTLIVAIETKQLLETFLACFDKTLKDQPYEQIEEVTKRIRELLAVGLSGNSISKLSLTEALAVGTGYLLLEKVLFTSDKIRTRYEIGRDQEDNFRLRLIIKPKSLRKWPWEFLWDRSLLVDDGDRYYEGFLGISRNKTICYSLSPSEELPYPQPLNRPLRMLFAVARPKYRDEVKPGSKLDEIMATDQLIQVQAALRGWCRVINLDEQHENITNVPGKVRIEIYVTDHTSWQKLQNVLKEHSQQPFDIFHYVGHGWFSNSESKGYCLALESEDDERLAKEISAAEIGKALAKHGISLVVLNGCETGQERETAEGIAQTVAGFEIPAVVGMRYRIRNIDSINFAAHFFAGLLDGNRPIDFLVNDTRNALGRRRIYDDLYERRTFQQGLQYLYPTVCLRPLDGYIFTTDGSQRHALFLEILEKAIIDLASYKWANETKEFLLKHPKEALGPLWVALLSDIDQSLRREAACVLGKTGDELAVYPLVEALTHDPDADVQRSCEEALQDLGQYPPALDMLVDQYANKDAPPKVLEVIETIDPAVADSAAWLRISTEFYQAVQDFYDPVAFLVRDIRFGGVGITDLIDEIESIYTNYYDLRQRETQLYDQIKSMDETIDTQIEGISDRAIGAIKEREKTREEKDEIDKQINKLLDSFFDSTYQTLTEILDFLELNEVALRALKQAFLWIIQRREELPDDIPPMIREKVEAQTERLNALRENLQALLEAEIELRRFAQRIQNFRAGFSPTS